MVTALYVGLAGFALIFYIYAIARRRMKLGVSLGAGKNEELERYIRAHANFVETVPIALILMAVLEGNGVEFWIIHWLGILVVFSRIIHFRGLTTGKGYGALRMAGMMLMMAVYAIGGGLCIWLALMS